MDYKICASCKLEKSVSNFRWNKTRYESWCSDCKKIHRKEWYQKNRESELQKAKDYHKQTYHLKKEHKIKKTNEWIKNNPEKYKVYAKRCYEKNKLTIFAYQALIRAKKRNAVPKWFDSVKDEVQKIYIEARKKTIETGIPHEVDHIIPLINDYVCGLHVPNNLQVLTRFENRSKQNKFKEF
jgi:thiol-disulfide isomerase/thioredoxin